MGADGASGPCRCVHAAATHHTTHLLPRCGYGRHVPCSALWHHTPLQCQHLTDARAVQRTMASHTAPVSTFDGRTCRAAHYGITQHLTNATPSRTVLLYRCSPAPAYLNIRDHASGPLARAHRTHAHTHTHTHTHTYTHTYTHMRSRSQRAHAQRPHHRKAPELWICRISQRR
jgi:hypothetical protein